MARHYVSLFFHSDEDPTLCVTACLDHAPEGSMAATLLAAANGQSTAGLPWADCLRQGPDCGAGTHHLYLWDVAGQRDDLREVLVREAEMWATVGEASVVSMDPLQRYLLGFAVLAVGGSDAAVRPR